MEKFEVIMMRFLQKYCSTIYHEVLIRKSKKYLELPYGEEAKQVELKGDK